MTTTSYPTPGAKHLAETGKSMRQTVLEAANRPEGCDCPLGLMSNRASNTGGGRPSDAARYVVKMHDDLGCEAFTARYEEGANSKTLRRAADSLNLQPGCLSERR